MQVLPDKRLHWDEAIRRVAGMRDKLGKPVDAGIVETVALLNMLNISTTASCEGHLEHGTGAPWVDLASKHPQAQISIAEMNSEALRKAEMVENQKEKAAIFEETHRIRREVKALHLQERQKLLCYLALFYQDRDVPYDQRLIIRPLGNDGKSRLESQGADCQEIAPLDIRAQKLREYQQEMQEF